MKKVIVITGQTATGKTKLALKYARKYNGELVNCDSRQIYKKLDIITGKDLTSNKVWLYDIVDPREHFSSYDYVNCALNAIKDIQARKKTPVIVGGSVFYLKHLLFGLTLPPIKPDWPLRKKLNLKTVNELQKILLKKDRRMFLTLNESDRQNPRRLIRRIEIVSAKNKPILKQNKSDLVIKKQIKIIGLKFSDRAKLIVAIKQRVEKRLKQGAVKEVKNLLKEGYRKTDPGLQTIGYQQLIAYLQGKITKENAIIDWQNKEIQYSKRQLTFLNKIPGVVWLISN